MDVSSRAAELLEFKSSGVARVRVEYVARAPLEGSDDLQLMATLRTGVPAPSPSLVRVASARPFVPEIPSSGRPIRGEIPLPEGRPYNLGNSSADQGLTSAPSETAGMRSRSASRALENSHAAAHDIDDRSAASVRPVSAYAPIEPQTSRDLLFGRGLY
jgi:rare lipoprotein A